MCWHLGSLTTDLGHLSITVCILTMNLR
jgi:hypothetical protein